MSIFQKLTKILFLISSSNDCDFSPKSISSTLFRSMTRPFSITTISRSRSIQFCAICDKVSVWLSIELIVFVHLRFMSVFWRWILSRFFWSATCKRFSPSWLKISNWSCWACEWNREWKIEKREKKIFFECMPWEIQKYYYFSFCVFEWEIRKRV